MIYAEKLAEFVRVTGSKPGEMNKRRLSVCMSGWGCILDAGHEGDCEEITGERHRQMVSLEPPSQSAGPGRCNRLTRAVALGDPTPCKLPANHEGPHEPS